MPNDFRLLVYRSAASQQNYRPLDLPNALRGPHFERWLSSEKAGPVRRYAELRPALADVEVSVERYTDQDQYLRSFGLGAPAVPVDGEYVPVEPSNAMLTGVATGVPSPL